MADNTSHTPGLGGQIAHTLGLLTGLFGFCWGIWWCAGCGKNSDPPQNQAIPTEKSPKSSPDHEKQPLDFTGLRGVLPGRWAKKDSNWFRIELTGKSIEELAHDFGDGSKPTVGSVGKYEMRGDLLCITDGRGEVHTYGVEFLSDSEMALRPENRGTAYFSTLAGQWQRMSLPPGKASVTLGTGTIADAKRQVQRIEKKVTKTESLLDEALADRDDIVTKLRSIGVKSPADLKGNVRGQRLAENVAKVTAEIDELERQLVSLDSELLKAKAIVRRMEREQAGLSEAEMRNLAEQLREAEERTDGIAATPTTPLDVETALEKAFKTRPGAKQGKRSK